MDKPEDHASVLINRKEPMTVRERPGERRQRTPKILAGIVIVMEMHFDLAEARTAERGQGIDQLRRIDLRGEEEGVTGAHAIRIPKPLREHGVLLVPTVHSRQAG